MISQTLVYLFLSIINPSDLQYINRTTDVSNQASLALCRKIFNDMLVFEREEIDCEDLDDNYILMKDGTIIAIYMVDEKGKTRVYCHISRLTYRTTYSFVHKCKLDDADKEELQNILKWQIISTFSPSQYQYEELSKNDSTYWIDN